MRKNLLSLLFLLLLCGGAIVNLNAQERDAYITVAEEEVAEEPSWDGPTFYQQLVDFLQLRGITVTSVIDKPFLNNHHELTAEIAAAFQVSECTISTAWTVGDVLCSIMEKRYNGPHSEIMDFERIQYSSCHKDFQEYMDHYPNSPRWHEAYEKYMVTFLATSWSYAMHYNNVHYCKDFLNKYKEFSANYCRGLFDESEEVPEGCRLHTIDYEGYDKIAVCKMADDAKEYLAEIFKAESEEAELWQRAQSQSSYAAYRDYCVKYPRGQWYWDALNAMEPQENPDWQRAVEANTREGYEAFLRHYPDGYYAPSAARYIQDLIRATRHPERDFCVELPVKEPVGMEYAQVGIANGCSMGYTYTITYTGGTGGQVVLRPGETVWLAMIRKERTGSPIVVLENERGDAEMYDVYIDKGVYLLNINNLDFEPIISDETEGQSKTQNVSSAEKKLIKEGKQKFGDSLLQRDEWLRY